MMKKEKIVCFIKPCRPASGSTVLNPIVVAENKLNGVETSICLDTNILVSMEKVVDGGNKWSQVRQYGLHNFVKLLQRCPPQSVCISPGLALSEMPPGIAESSRQKYEAFCSEHLSGFVDTPNCIHSYFSGKRKDYGFEDLPNIARATLSIPFSSILYLNLVDRFSRGTPYLKFIRYLDLLEERIGILSAAQVEIAKICLAEPGADSRDTIELKRKLRSNFLKTSHGKLPNNASEVIRVAFNAASDIHLLQSANLIDEHGIDGKPQDSWIATKDEKLAEFNEIFHHVNLDGEIGKFAATTINTEDSKNSYWEEADYEFGRRVFMRRASGVPLNKDIDDLLFIANRAIEDIKEKFS